jgi:hypothetical protein
MHSFELRLFFHNTLAVCDMEKNVATSFVEKFSPPRMPM